LRGACRGCRKGNAFSGEIASDAGERFSSGTLRAGLATVTSKKQGNKLSVGLLDRKSSERAITMPSSIGKKSIPSEDKLDAEIERLKFANEELQILVDLTVHYVKDARDALGRTRLMLSRQAELLASGKVDSSD
jgi:hypothetical protein